MFMLNVYNASFCKAVDGFDSCYTILKCFIKEKRNFRRAVLSDDRSYSSPLFVSEICLMFIRASVFPFF